MKKILFIFLLTCTIQINAQCPITVTGNHSVCDGISDTLTASGATSYTWMPSGDTGASIIVTPTVTTTYTVTANTGTCLATNTINVTVHQLPAVTFTTDINYPNFDIYPTYSSNVATASWEIEIDSRTAIYITPYSYNRSFYYFYNLYPQGTVTITNPGTGGYITDYTVCVKVGDVFGCVDTNYYCCGWGSNTHCEWGNLCTECDTSTATIVYDVNVSQNPTTGFDKLAKSNSQISIYPNPSNGIFNLSISQFDNEKTHDIEIYNLIGECVHRQNIISATSKIDVNSLPNGIYNISLTSSKGIENKHIVIVK